MSTAYTQVKNNIKLTDDYIFFKTIFTQHSDHNPHIYKFVHSTASS